VKLVQVEKRSVKSLNAEIRSKIVFLENLLFCKRTDVKTTSMLVFSVMDHFLEWDRLNWKSCTSIGPCTEAGNSGWKRPLERYSGRWKDHIKIHLIQDRNQWRVFVNTVMNHKMLDIS
jgi:hypothetical protein